LEPVPVNVVCDFAKQNAVLAKDTVRFANEGRVKVREVVAVFQGRLEDQPKASIEILLLILALIGNVRWIIDNHVKAFILERHLAIIGNDVREEFLVNIDAYYLALTALPKATDIDCSVKYQLWPLLRVKSKHALQEFGIRALPD
jgi:hypothetical protein